MRTIKFRAWNTQHNRALETGWAYPTEFRHDSNDFVLDIPENIILMQFTGLLDKKGKEIYENDIYHYVHSVATYFNYKVAETTRNYIVRFGGYVDKTANNGGGVGWYLEDILSGEKRQWLYGGTVIGNIFESPDLLK